MTVTDDASRRVSSAADLATHVAQVIEATALIIERSPRSEIDLSVGLSAFHSVCPLHVEAALIVLVRLLRHNAFGADDLRRWAPTIVADVFTADVE